MSTAATCRLQVVRHLSAKHFAETADVLGKPEHSKDSLSREYFL